MPSPPGCPAASPVVCATSGMGAPSMSIVVNELVQVGIRTIIRVGTSGSIQDHVQVGSVVIGSGRAHEPGRRPRHRPARVPRPSPTRSSPSPSPTPPRALGIDHHVGVMASADTFFEGQERSQSSANPHLLRRLRGMIDEYHDLGILNFEMEAGTLFKMGLVYGFGAGRVVGIVAQRNEAEEPDPAAKDRAVDNAIRVAVAAADALVAADRHGSPPCVEPDGRCEPSRSTQGVSGQPARSASQPGSRVGRPSVVTAPWTVTAVAAVRSSTVSR